MLRRIAPALAALALVPSLVACGSDDEAAPGPSASPTGSPTGATEPMVTVRSTRTSSGSSCSKVPNNAHVRAYLISGLTVTGGSITVTAAKVGGTRTGHLYYAGGRDALQQGAVLDGPLAGRAAKAWERRTTLKGATLPPGRYWLLAEVRIDNSAHVSGIRYDWTDSGGGAGTQIDDMDARWDTVC